MLLVVRGIMSTLVCLKDGNQTGQYGGSRVQRQEVRSLFLDHLASGRTLCSRPTTPWNVKLGDALLELLSVLIVSISTQPGSCHYRKTRCRSREGSGFGEKSLLRVDHCPYILIYLHSYEGAGPRASMPAPPRPHQPLQRSHRTMRQRPGSVLSLPLMLLRNYHLFGMYFCRLRFSPTTSSTDQPETHSK